MEISCEIVGAQSVETESMKGTTWHSLHVIRGANTQVTRLKVADIFEQFRFFVSWTPSA